MVFIFKSSLWAAMRDSRTPNFRETTSFLGDVRHNPTDGPHTPDNAVAKPRTKFFTSATGLHRESPLFRQRLGRAMSDVIPPPGANMSQRAVLQYLSLAE